jgi:putative ABC transport system ATP-binding protein
LAGLDEPDGGSVTLGDERISHRPELERARIRSRRLGVLLQSGNLIAHLSVAANIRLVQRGNASTSPTELLEQVGLGGRASALPRELSGGELARAGLAVAVSNDPDVLLADEPTGELDGRTEQLVLDLVRARAADGRGVLLVTHSPAVTQIADRVIALSDGRLAA